MKLVIIKRSNEIVKQNNEMIKRPNEIMKLQMIKVYFISPVIGLLRACLGDVSNLVFVLLDPPGAVLGGFLVDFDGVDFWAPSAFCCWPDGLLSASSAIGGRNDNFRIL